jgi:hypothetical protein
MQSLLLVEKTAQTRDMHPTRTNVHTTTLITLINVVIATRYQFFRVLLLKLKALTRTSSGKAVFCTKADFQQ